MKETGFGKKGWMLIVYCFVTFYVCTAFKDTMNVAVLTFQEQYDWNQTALLSLASIGAYVTCIAIYILGVLNASGKLKLRKIILITGVIYAITIALWGVIPNFAIFVVNYIVMTIGYTVWSQHANNAMCGNWFPKKSGAVLGWSTIGFPLAAATNAILFHTLMKYMEFKQIYFAFGAVSLLVCLWGYFCFRDYPEEMGCYPDNDTSMTPEKVQEFLRMEKEYGLDSIWGTKQMLAIKETWFICIANGVMILIASGSMGQMVIRFMNGGMSIEKAIQMMTIVGVCAMAGSWAFGKFDYKVGVKKAVLVAMALLAVACTLYSINTVATMTTGSILIGIGLGAATNFVVSCTSHYWGRKNFKKAYGPVLTVTTLIGSAGAITVANLAAIFNYSFAYLILSALSVIGFVCMLLVKENFVEEYEAKLNFKPGKI